MSLYRDEAIVLRTHKLGEADRIVTLLTRDARQGPCRRQGRAPHDVEVRRRGSSRSCTSTCSSARAATSTSSRRSRRSDRSAPRSARTTRATPPARPCSRRPTASSRPSTSPRVQQYWLLVGARARAGVARRTRPAWCSTRTCCARSRSPAGRRPSPTARAAARPGPHRAFAVAQGGAVCRRAGPRAPPRRRPRRSCCSPRCSAGDWAVADASAERHRARGQRPGRRVLQWHLERQLRSLPMVERV